MRFDLKVVSFLAPAVLLAYLPAAYAAPGAIFSTIYNGTIVNANTQYASKCAVYLDGGPGAKVKAGTPGLPDGLYYFQVTDPSGGTLLSTDPVTNRQFQVTGGVITAYTGNTPAGMPTHLTSIDAPHAVAGAITISLANTDCPNDFLDSPNSGGEYKVWATPSASFVGDPSAVDSPCSGDCYHGFVPSQSKTDNFKVKAGRGQTFCLSVIKQIVEPNGNFDGPGANWQMTVQDASGTSTDYLTNAVGMFSVCGLAAGTYTVTESLTDSFGNSYTINGLMVNGVPVTINPLPTSYNFTWVPGQDSVTVVFQNTAGGGVPE